MPRTMAAGCREPLSPSCFRAVAAANQLDAAAAGAGLVELELSDEELLDSELPPEPLDELAELLAGLLAASRLSVR